MGIPLAVNGLPEQIKGMSVPDDAGMRLSLAVNMDCLSARAALEKTLLGTDAVEPPPVLKKLVPVVFV